MKALKLYGYYWIKIDDNSKWEIARYVSTSTRLKKYMGNYRWHILGRNLWLECVFNVGERILNPNLKRKIKV